MPIWIWKIVAAFLILLVLGMVGYYFEALPRPTREVVGGAVLVLFLLYLAVGIGYWVIWPLVAGP